MTICLVYKDVSGEIMRHSCIFICLVLASLVQFITAGELTLQQQGKTDSNSQHLPGFFLPDIGFQTLRFDADNQMYLGQRSVTLSGLPAAIEASHGGSYFAFIQKGAQTSDGNHEINIGVMTADLELLFTIAALQYLDEGMPLVRISEEFGSTLIGRAANGQLLLYDRSGQLIREIRLFSEDQHDLESFLDARFATDGTLLVLATRRGSAAFDEDAPNASGEPTLFGFDRNGKLIWRKALPGESVNQLVVDHETGNVMVNPFRIYSNGNLQSFSVIYDAEGREILRLNRHFKSALINQEAEEVWLMSNRRISSYRLNDGQLRWATAIPGSDILLASVTAEAGGILLTGKEHWENNGLIYSQLILRQFGSNGDMLFENKIVESSKKMPQMRISADRRMIAVMLDQQYWIYEVQK